MKKLKVESQSYKFKGHKYVFVLSTWLLILTVYIYAAPN